MSPDCPTKSVDPSSTAAASSRRQWLKAGAGFLLGAGVGLTARDRDADRASEIRPPGARPESSFLAACIRCGQCVLACPSDTLALAPLTSGRSAGAPRAQDLRRHPCTLCRDQDRLQCIDICPTDALLDLDELLGIRMGTARIDPELCWAFNRILCRSCWHACPWPDKALRLDERLHPVVIEEVCIGCGLCAHACPTEPGSITVVPRKPSSGRLPGGRTLG